ncbi:MAG: hypothetical protein RIC35_05840 [Marinoscillum sp.]
MKYYLLVCLALISTVSAGQTRPDLSFWIEDKTGDKRINDLDILYLYVPDINKTIEKEEWDRKDIDLSINDISLNKITPRRIPKDLVSEENKEDTIRQDVLAFVIQKELLSREQLDAIRFLETKSQVYVSLKLPNDAVINETVKVEVINQSGKLQVLSWFAVGSLAVFLVWVGFWKGALKDISNANTKPYSFSRSQLWWWTLIVLTSWVYILISSSDYGLNTTALALLGISGATLAAGYAIDKKDEQDIAKAAAAPQALTGPPPTRHQNTGGTNWFNDILTDQTGNISIHRVQVFLFNITFGIYYLVEVYNTMQIPTFDESVLGLLGISNGVYTAVKFNENN